MDTNILEKDKNVGKPDNDSIGCNATKEKQQKSPSSQGVNWRTLSVGLLLGGFIALAIVVVWANFCTRTESKDTPVNVQLTIKDVKDIEKTDGNAIDKVLQSTAEKAFYQGRKEAQNEFDKNFTTLLTILTVFGIAWPVIIAILQSMKFSQDQKTLEKLIEEHDKLSQKNRILQQDVRQICIELLMQSASNNLKFASLQGFVVEKKTEETECLIDDAYRKKNFVFLLLLDAITYYIHAEAQEPSKIDDINSSMEQIRLCAFFVENLNFNYYTYKDDVFENHERIKKIVYKLSSLKSNHPYCSEAIEHLKHAMQILDDNFKNEIDGTIKDKEI